MLWTFCSHWNSLFPSCRLPLGGLASPTCLCIITSHVVFVSQSMNFLCCCRILFGVRICSIDDGTGKPLMTNSNRRNLHFRCERLYAVMHFRVRPWSANASLRALVFVWEGFNFFALTFMLRSSIVFEAVDSFFPFWKQNGLVTKECASTSCYFLVLHHHVWPFMKWDMWQDALQFGILCCIRC